MANYIQIRAKKASDVIGAGVISYALIGSFLLYKFHINLMEYTTPIILGFVVITVSFACTKRFFYHIMMENSNLLSFSMQKEFISVSSTINEPQSEPQSEPQKANNDTQENEVGGQETLKSGQEIPKVDKKGGQETTKVDRKDGQKTRESILNLIVANSRITSTQIVESLGINRSAVTKQLKKLQDDGVIKREGPKKGGQWIIIKK
mgnify:CR=1 FL=1